MSGNTGNNEEEKKFLVETISVTAVLVPLFYTAGWSYAYNYFERFNLGLTGLEIPKEYFFVYSYGAVKNQFWLFAVSLLVFAALFFYGKPILRKIDGLFSRERVSSFIRFLPTVLVPLLIFLMFHMFYFLGDRAAVGDFCFQAESGFPSYHRVRVWAEAPDKSEELEKDWQTGNYRLLMRNKDHLFLFHPGKPGELLPTHIIPSGKIEMVRILPVNRKDG